jgi:phenylacetate-coenzyme A ligase PaaK-like adenylate-forming protein
MLINRLCQLRRLMGNQWLSPAELNELQNRKLRAVVKYACENVPYYHNLFDSVDLKPKDIQTTEDLIKIPITSRTDIQRQSPDQIISRGIDAERCIKLRKSGTTGIPLTVYLAPEEHLFRGLIEFRGLFSIGFKPNDRLVIIGSSWKRNIRWFQRLGLFRIVNISPFIEAEQQIQQTKKFKPTILWVYPSFLKILISSLNEHDAKEIEP